MSSLIINDEAYEALAVAMVGRSGIFMGKLHLLDDESGNKVRGHILCICEGTSLEAKIVTALWFANLNAYSGRYREPLPKEETVKGIYNKLVSRIKKRFLGIELADDVHHSAVEFDARKVASLYRCWEYQCSEIPTENQETHKAIMATFGLFIADLLSDALSKGVTTRTPGNLEPTH